jgi:hypothetical protein
LEIRGTQEEAQPEATSYMVNVTTTNIFYQQGLYFSERETEDKQEEKLVIASQCVTTLKGNKCLDEHN